MKREMDQVEEKQKDLKVLIATTSEQRNEFKKKCEKV